MEEEGQGKPPCACPTPYGDALYCAEDRSPNTPSELLDPCTCSCHDPEPDEDDWEEEE